VDGETEDTEADTERSAASTPSLETTPSYHEVELVFKPLSHDVGQEDSSLTQTRFIKTTVNASVDHLVKYLSMRHLLDCTNNGTDGHQDSKEASEGSLFTIYVAAGPGQYQPLLGSMTLENINEKHWRVNRPLELYYAYKIQKILS
jgi:E3 ubiquitin-protein ligase RNF1/2